MAENQDTAESRRLAAIATLAAEESKLLGLRGRSHANGRRLQEIDEELKALGPIMRQKPLSEE